MTDEECQAFVDDQTWIFAKTMPQWPHWYCLRAAARHPEAFDAFASHIHKVGYLAEFRPENRAEWAVRRYIDLGLHHYWTMADTPSEATLINRAEHPIIAVRL
jgi:hypothetical protein